MTTFSRILSLESPMLRGSDVLAAQRALRSTGDLSVEPDGLFGPQTAGAVQAFRQRRRLPNGNTVDEPTWNALFSEPSAGPAGDPPSVLSQLGTPHQFRDSVTWCLGPNGVAVGTSMDWRPRPSVEIDASMNATDVKHWVISHPIATRHHPWDGSFEVTMKRWKFFLSRLPLSTRKCRNLGGNITLVRFILLQHPRELALLTSEGLQHLAFFITLILQLCLLIGLLPHESADTHNEVILPLFPRGDEIAEILVIRE